MLIILEIFKRIKEEFEEVGYPYDFSSESFFEFSNEYGRYNLQEISDGFFGETVKKSYSTKRELEENFTSLHDFLDYAKFVGRGFLRTRPIIDNVKKEVDSTYTLNLAACMNKIYLRNIVLYATQELFLIKKILETPMGMISKIDLVSSRYIEDGKYMFYGKTFEEYKDKYLLINEINAQINGFGRKRTL